ncbi:PucR family transcriptional regulator ligand-binding domain-containing protein [Streptomyces sp. WMMC500]|uniref:PucR family transcriptional regulator n=1 Tax=Streptomyces sp. WMMC500 TaxID=3015154 RepID=UPI00248CEF9E|nr:PucR family transcriptional regulator [Streptomyces sp. WMMC500]WBB62203.1 PucR family transcriptional regulator ligand-binding domain-containing protein [Streptomyces sp. WMMC500]
MRLRALLESEALGLRLLGGEDELDRTVRGVMTTDLTDPSRYLSGGELVLTGLAWRHGPQDSEPFVRILAAAGVAGLAAGEAELSGAGVPEDLVRACARHRLPLFAVDENVAFATVTEHVVRQVSGERAGDLAAVVERHRRLMSSGPAGGGPDVVLDLLGSDLDLRAWVLSPTGRQIAGTASAAAGGRLPARLRAQLAGEHLGALRGGRPGPHRVTLPVAGGAVTYSLFPVGGGRDLRETVLSDWLLAVEADAGEWPPERLDLVHGVTQLIAVERERRDAARAVRRRLAQEVLELLQAGAQPGEVAARLRVAVPVLLPGIGAAPQWQVVVARVEWEVPPGQPGIAGGPVAQAMLEELLAGSERDRADRIAVAHTGDEAVALVPLPAPAAPAARAEAPGAPAAGGAVGGGDPDGRPGRGAVGAGPGRGPAGGPAAGAGEPGAGKLSAAALLAAVREPLARGLADDGRLTLGVSAAVHTPEGLRGALEEARHARRVAAARPGRVCAAGHEELASHVLLLPFVPDDVRRAFTARLLDPLRAYDHRHRAGLVETLEAFLDCDGSWTRCAARLHLHVNTLRYRVGRIEQLTGRDLARLEDKLDFFLALRMR